MASALKKFTPHIIIFFFLLIGAVLFIRLKSYSVLNPLPQDVVIGRENAPVTIVMFGSYECSVSGEFFKTHYPAIKSEYIDTGKARFVYRNFYADISSSDAVATEAALCANEQGRFWDYNAVLFEKMNEWLNRYGSKETEEIFNPVFTEYAGSLELDTNTFSACLYQHKYRSRLRDEFNYAHEIGVAKTPSFYINGLMIDGLPSLDDFKSILSKFSY